MNTMNLNTTIEDFEWVVKILESSKNKAHADVAMKCFILWESKHIGNSLTTSESSLITELRETFWSKFKNKINKVGTVSISESI